MFLKISSDNAIIEKGENGLEVFLSLDEKAFEKLMKAVGEKVPTNVIEKYLFPRCTRSFGLDCRMDLSCVSDKKGVD